MTTEYVFRLPLGLLDAAGKVHQEGQMRRAVVADEKETPRDPRVQANPDAFDVVLLSRVITRLGGYAPVNAEVISALFLEDFHYLQTVFLQVNGFALQDLLEVQCPQCSHRFLVDAAPSASDVTDTIAFGVK